MTFSISSSSHNQTTKFDNHLHDFSKEKTEQPSNMPPNATSSKVDQILNSINYWKYVREEDSKLVDGSDISLVAESIQRYMLSSGVTFDSVELRLRKENCKTFLHAITGPFSLASYAVKISLHGNPADQDNHENLSHAKTFSYTLENLLVADKTRQLDNIHAGINLYKNFNPLENNATIEKQFRQSFAFTHLIATLNFSKDYQLFNDSGERCKYSLEICTYRRDAAIKRRAQLMSIPVENSSAQFIEHLNHKNLLNAGSLGLITDDISMLNLINNDTCTSNHLGLEIFMSFQEELKEMIALRQVTLSKLLTTLTPNLSTIISFSDEIDSTKYWLQHLSTHSRQSNSLDFLKIISTNIQFLVRLQKEMNNLIEKNKEKLLGEFTILSTFLADSITITTCTDRALMTLSIKQLLNLELLYKSSSMLEKLNITPQIKLSNLIKNYKKCPTLEKTLNLPNVGNSSYLNSTLQLLKASRIMNELSLKKELSKQATETGATYKNRAILFKSMQLLLSAESSNPKQLLTSDLSNFKTALFNSNLSDDFNIENYFLEHDSRIFLDCALKSIDYKFTLESLTEAVYEEKKYSDLKTVDLNGSLPLSLSKLTFEEQIKQEYYHILKDGVKWQPILDEHEEVVTIFSSQSKTSFKEMPNSLFIQIKRFNEDGSKNESSLRFDNPEAIDLTLFTSTLPLNPQLFEIAAFSVHSGKTTTDGHYITYSKEGPHWIQHSDDISSIIPNEKILEAMSEAYLIVLNKKNNSLRSN